MNVIGANIKRYREHNNYSQNELSDFISCSREQISYFENGSRVPKIDVLTKISDLFGIELSELLEESSEIIDENLVLAFRKNDSSNADFEEIVSFKKIIKNYMKMERLVTEHGL